ncbi:amino acid transporter [Diaporthe helianthi]|uniref:Amino acid transporter n=1 Tax=Diaporthe helianthi TaxID=158607 RepID=A0A2P5HRD7_DIAHE|nr:amino acid transporter [Diaporthe helianthi]
MLLTALIHYIHIVQANLVHHVGAFLPWHRLFVWAHEVLLQRECGFTGAQPYWDELSENEQISNGTLTFDQLAVFDHETGFGGKGLLQGNGCVTDGPFADLTLHLNSSGLPADANGAGYCLSRNFNAANFQKGKRSNIKTCFGYDARECYETNPHSAGRSGVGAMWQQADLPSRQADMSGRNVPPAEILARGNLSYSSAAELDYDGDPGNVTTLNHTLWMGDLIAKATVGDVMDLGGQVSCAEYV